MLYAIALTHDDAAFLADYFAHLRQHVDGFVVADLGSTDGTLEAIQTEPAVTAVISDHRDAASAVVAAVTRARDLGASHVLLLDPDERLEQRFADTLRDHIASAARAGRHILGVWARTLDEAGASYLVHGTYGLDHKFIVFTPSDFLAPAATATKRLTGFAAYRLASPTSAAAHRRLGAHAACRPDARAIDLQARPPRLRPLDAARTYHGAPALPDEVSLDGAAAVVEQIFAACTCDDWEPLGALRDVEVSHDLKDATKDLRMALAAWWRKLDRVRSFATNEPFGTDTALGIYKGERWDAILGGWCQVTARAGGGWTATLCSTALDRQLWERIFANVRRLKPAPSANPPRDDGDEILLSVVMPFYKRLADFARVLPLTAPSFERAGVEVVLCLDEPTEETGVLALVRSYPRIRWSVLVNDDDHPWRTPSRAINVGIRHAVGRYLLVCSPESAFVNDITQIPRRLQASGSGVAAIGWVAFATYADLAQHSSVGACYTAIVTGKAGQAAQTRKLPYGSLCVERERLVRIGAYDEELEVWGGDDDNTRVRLDLDGTAIAMCDDMQVLHLADKPRVPPHVRRGIDQLLPIWKPARAVANPRGWGQTFQRVALSWRPTQ